VGTSYRRDLYFDKHIKNQPTGKAYLEALIKSPYRTHQRIGSALKKQYMDFEAEIKREAEAKESADTTEV
jgi:hypothetical protein